MSHMPECPVTATTGKFGVPRPFTKVRPLKAAAKHQLAAGLLLLSCGSMANAALIEIPRISPDRNQAGNRMQQLVFLQDHAFRNRLNAHGIIPATASALDRPTFGATYMHNTGAHSLRAMGGIPVPNPDPFAAIDTPHGAIDSSAASEDTDPELWAVLLVATGLIGYQIRRKSRIGAVMIRPLRP
jgi:hypothetical protein